MPLVSSNSTEYIIVTYKYCITQALKCVIITYANTNCRLELIAMSKRVSRLSWLKFLESTLGWVGRDIPFDRLLVRLGLLYRKEEVDIVD